MPIHLDDDIARAMWPADHIHGCAPRASTSRAVIAHVHGGRPRSAEAAWPCASPTLRLKETHHPPLRRGQRERRLRDHVRTARPSFRTACVDPLMGALEGRVTHHRARPRHRPRATRLLFGRGARMSWSNDLAARRTAPAPTRRRAQASSTRSPRRRRARVRSHAHSLFERRAVGRWSSVRLASEWSARRRLSTTSGPSCG